MAQFHFVEDYERHVADLIVRHPIDEAMSLAVGGHYEAIGQIELALLRRVGLTPGASILDLGCGSGRLASALGASGVGLQYVGIDVVQQLLDYAASKSPPSYRFILHRELSLPLADASIDIACAFSVFTHLLHEETFIYLRDMRRALRRNGRIVFSFLEFAEPLQWAPFQGAWQQRLNGIPGTLVTYIERNAIQAWASHLDLVVETFIDGQENFGAGPLGQSVAVLVASPS